MQTIGGELCLIEYSFNVTIAKLNEALNEANYAKNRIKEIRDKINKCEP